MTNLKKILGMPVFLASSDCSSTAVRSTSGSSLLPPVQCQYLGFGEENFKVLHSHPGGGNMRAFPAPTLAFRQHCFSSRAEACAMTCLLF